MPKKTQRKFIRYLPSQIKTEQTGSGAFDIKGAIAILGGVTGIIVAILWLGGRYYMTGYYSAMNIPSFQVNFSIWEYAESAWLRMIVYFLNRVTEVLLPISIISFILLFIQAIVKRAFPQLSIFGAVKNIESQAKTVWKYSKSMFVILISIFLLYLFVLSLGDLYYSGRDDGRSSVFHGSHLVEVYSKEVLPLGPSIVLPNASIPTLNQYSGLRLLAYNNGKYFLFRDVDLSTCKPAQVFIIDDAQDIHIVLGNIVPINTPCTAASVISVTATALPTPVTSPTP